MALERQRDEHESRFPRVPASREPENDEPPPVDLDEVQIWDLLEAFTKLMAEVGVRKPKYHEVTYDDTPIDLHAADIEDRLTREGRLTLRDLITGRSYTSADRLAIPPPPHLLPDVTRWAAHSFTAIDWVIYLTLVEGLLTHT